jgi:cell division protein FtsQ
MSVVLRPLTGVLRLVRAGAAFVLQRRRLRITLLAVVIALPLLGCGWLWLRRSSFASVQRVQISGVHGPETDAVDAALARAAHRMSTLDVSAGALRAAVAPLLVVRALRAIPSFPHGLRIEVSEQLPVAALTVAGVRTAVAADGVVLGPALLSGSLPSVSGSLSPSGDDTVASAPGRRVSGASLLGALTVLGAAPAPLAKHVERVFTGAKGLTVAMRNGLLVYFGDASRPHAKWLSLARVLADPSSAGASYVDVRLPSHPAAGFPAGVSAPDASTAASAGAGEQVGSSESTIASLAARLSGGTTTASPTGTEPAVTAPSTSAPSSQSPEASTGEAAAGSEAAGSQTNPAPGG